MFRTLARAVRRAPIIRNMTGFWDKVRKPYHWLLDRNGKGVLVKVGRVISVRMPAEFTVGNWEEYEAAEIAEVVAWLAQNRGGQFIDVGCHLGIYSLVSLTEGVRAIAIDSDLSALKGTLRMCEFAGTPDVLWGFASDTNSSGFSCATELREFTLQRIEETQVTGDWNTLRYVNIEGAEPNIPSHALDDILPRHRPTLIKCDIEGAEQLMLAGLCEFLAEVRPEICLSVHPQFLSQHGHSEQSVRLFLEARGYEIRELVPDHELHWWCVPL